MEIWELIARECIRDLVARYNANADSGRYDEVLALFAVDATMELPEETCHGDDAIRRMFEKTAERARTMDLTSPGFLRHFITTHQIDLHDETSASGRSYFAVLTAEGLDHWGRYLDEYRVIDSSWRFWKRRVRVDGMASTSRFSGASTSKSPDGP